MAKNKDTFVTVTGFKHYYGLAPFRIGRLIRCAKEPENPFDSDAVRAFLPCIGKVSTSNLVIAGDGGYVSCIGKVGYIANSPDTRAGGTESASRIYDRVPKRFYIRVLFTTFTKVICRVERGDMNALNREFDRQCVEDGDTNWD